MTTKLDKQVREFHELIGAPILDEPISRDSIDIEYANFRASLIESELDELYAAIEERDPVSIADALADLNYALSGTALSFGMPLDELTDEVHRSNMTKSPNPRGKAIKGTDYSPPDLGPILYPRGVQPPPSAV